ncbi:MAG: nucleotidyltransferase family protein [Flavipsychrobacter sp.]|nr:nucleotidyltransferase family protein [Flavipsychrobacter sp.]
MECIVLAGGLGTRLRGAIGDYPKCMASVNGQPFLHYIFRYLAEQGCTKAILSLGYKAEVVTEWLGNQQLPFAVSYVTEQEPLGTGGGIQLALATATDKNVVVLNGDTMFQVPIKELLHFHTNNGAATTLALKQMHNFDRYGIVQTDSKGIITAFEEKRAREHGLINGGVYIIDKAAFVERHLPEKFSFEKDYLEAYLQEHKFYGQAAGAYFIDIGIPDDYNQAQEDFKTMFA